MTKPENPLEINTDQVRRLLVNFMQMEMENADFHRAVVGVSGGVDSALSCYLAAEAFQPENVLAIRLPYKTSSHDSLDHADLVIQATGVRESTIPITDLVEPLIKRFPEADRIRRGNMMARMRMIVLYDQSAAFNGLVVGTGNKTEILLGYTTLYGDAACAFNPLGDLYKTQVRQLARSMDIPDVIIDKPPSAELWVGQTDEGELGFTYEEVDRLLALMVDQGCTPQTCVDAGFDQDFVDAVIDRMQRNRFKRFPPPIAKLNSLQAVS